MNRKKEKKKRKERKKRELTKTNVLSITLNGPEAFRALGSTGK
jgi:hypothetical protein